MAEHRSLDGHGSRANNRLTSKPKQKTGGNPGTGIPAIFIPSHNTYQKSHGKRKTTIKAETTHSKNQPQKTSKTDHHNHTAARQTKPPAENKNHQQDNRKNKQQKDIHKTTKRTAHERRPYRQNHQQKNKQDNSTRQKKTKEKPQKRQARQTTTTTQQHDRQKPPAENKNHSRRCKSKIYGHLAPRVVFCRLNGGIPTI